MTPPPGKVAFGGIEVPIKNFGPALDCLRAHMSKELERLESGIHEQGRLHYDLQRQVDEMTVVLENLRDQIEDSQRPSVVDVNFEARIMSAIERIQKKSTPPDIEVSVGSGRSVRGKGWMVITLSIICGLAIVLFAALWKASDIAGAIRK